MYPRLETDPSQFNRRWRPALMSFFLRRIRNHQEAEDLTQEVFARLLGKGGAMGALADAYVFQVAANLLRDGARRWKVREDYRVLAAPLQELAAESLDPARVAIGRDALSALVGALETLPDRTRTIFILYRIENIEMDVIAESYAISKSAVKKHVMRAMTTLMARMRESQ
jgi:RNA polymerase sigma factor (sigma-70 family)